MSGSIARLRRALDVLYGVAGVLAAVSMVTILGLIVAQMVARWTGGVFPGAADYAGYAMAATSFLAFAYALNRGSHIRVGILLNAAGPRLHRALELWCLAVGSVLLWYFVWHAGRFVYWSRTFGDVSQGQDATPLWIPQLAMLIGAVVFAIALTDNFLHLLLTGRSRIRETLPGAGAESGPQDRG